MKKGLRTVIGLLKANFLSKAMAFMLLCSFATNGLQAQLSVILQAQPPLCGGFTTGSMTAIPSGSPGPYTYLWSNGATTNPIQNLGVGTYSVTVTSSTGATATATGSLAAPPMLTATINVTSCVLLGSMTVTATGGVPPYMYMWETGANTPTITNLSPGEYCVTVMDANNCGFVTCNYIGPNMGAIVATTNVNCVTGTGGTAIASATGGVGPFQYLWNNGATNDTITNLSAGTYTVTVTGYNNCTATASGTVVISPGNFNINLNVMHPTCVGTSNGSITANVTGGTLPYIYVWSNGGSGQTISNLTPGNYTVTVTDAVGCTSTKSTALFNQSNIAVTATKTNPSCANASNGSTSSNPSGGVAPYFYLWNNGATTQNLTGIPAGTYTVTVTDNVGCSASASVTLTGPPAFVINVTSTNASACGATNGSATASPVSGGSPPYTYQWSNGATNNVVSGLPAGTYSVTVTSANGCTATGSTVVTQPMILNVSISGSSLICAGSNTGILTATATLGTAPYTYAWSNGGNTQVISNLPPGTYTVIVTSSQGCTGTATKVISGNSAINVTAQATNNTCFGASAGQVTLTVSGGTPPYSYLWNTGATTANLNNLAAGNYSVTVTDAANCSAVQSAQVTQPPVLTLTLSNSGGTCGATGFISAVVSGGTPNYTYLWSNGQTVSTIGNLTAGTYSVTVTDANGCTKVGTSTLPAFPAINLTVNTTNTTCNGTNNGTATAVVSGGTAPISYLWNTGSNSNVLTSLGPGLYVVTVTDGNGCTASASNVVQLGAGLGVTIASPGFACPGSSTTATANATGGTFPYFYLWSNGQATQTADNLFAGNYIVTVTDINGCFGTASVTIQNGGGFNVNSTVSDVSCFGLADGSITVTPSGGGSPPFTYLWNTGATTPSISNLIAGNYNVTVNDATDCPVTLTVTVAQPDQLVVIVTGNNGACGAPGGAVTQVFGGNMPYTYLWSNGQTTQNISDLAPGTYTVTVTDGHQCTATGSTVISLIPVPTCSIQITQKITSLGGTNGQLTATASTGTGPFTYIWSNGQTTSTISNLAPGTYTVTVTDANGCQTNCVQTLYEPAKIGDFVWLDDNMNGVQNVGENGIQGVVVNITGTDIYGAAFNGSANTDGTGMYMFLVQAGTYKITFVKPAGLNPSPANQGGNDATDSDAEVTTGMSPMTTLVPGETNLTVDAGFFPAPPCENITVPGTICCDQTLCGPGNDPAPLTQTAPATGGIGAIEFLWMYSTVPGPFNPAYWYPIAGSTGPNYDPGPLSETTYFVRCVRREDCIDYLESNIITITVDDVAVADIHGPDGVCVNTPATYFATDNGPGATYNWTFSGGSPATANTPIVNGVVWTTFGVKTITLTVTNDGCTSIDTLLVSVSNSPVYCGNALIINAEEVNASAVAVEWYYAEADSVERKFQVEWAWENDLFEAVGEADSIFNDNGILRYKALHAGAKRGMNFYRVKLEDSDGTVLYSNTVEVLLRGDVNLVHVYPNPFNDYIDVEIFDRYDAEITFELVSPEGRVVEVFEAPADDYKKRVDMSDKPAGMYFLLVKYDRQLQKIFKLVKW